MGPGYNRLVVLVLLLLHMVERLAIPREDRLLRMKHLLYILLCLGAVAALIIKGEDPGAWPLACFLYLVATLAGCVIEFIRKRNKWSLIVLILAVILFGLGGFLMFLPDVPAETMQQLISADAQSLDTLMVLINTFILIDTQAIMKIMPMAFSNIRMDILKRIIRKTYAVEILAGIAVVLLRNCHNNRIRRHVCHIIHRKNPVGHTRALRHYCRFADYIHYCELLRGSKERRI